MHKSESWHFLAVFCDISRIEPTNAACSSQRFFYSSTVSDSRRVEWNLLFHGEMEKVLG